MTTEANKALVQQYLDELNPWRVPYGDPAFTLPLTDDETEEVFDRLESAVSPENLHCDGEISNKAAERKLNYLLLVWKALEDVTGIERENEYDFDE